MLSHALPCSGMIRLVETDVQSGPSKEKQVVDGFDSVNKSVYLWEDWVTLYSREKLHTLRDGIPLTARCEFTAVTILLSVCTYSVGDECYSSCL